MMGILVALILSLTIVVAPIDALAAVWCKFIPTGKIVPRAVCSPALDEIAAEPGEVASAGYPPSPPQYPPSPAIVYASLPVQTPVHLEAATVEKFVDWVVVMPSSQIPDVEAEIAKAASDAALVDAVASRLSFKLPAEYGRRLIYLSVLGQLKNPRAIPALAAYLNSPECPVFEEQRQQGAAAGSPAGEVRTSYFDACAGLKSAAVNMLAYLNTPAARELVLQAVQSHPSKAVRLSAMNSYLFNNHDSAEALAAVRQRTRKEEMKFVGLPRLAPQFSLKEFNARVAQFYNEYPEERQQPVPAKLPPKPGNAPVEGHAHDPSPPSAKAPNQ